MPVSTTSPGCSVKLREQKASSSATPKTISARAGVLDEIAVDAGPQAQLLRIADRRGLDNARAERAEGVEALTADPLSVGELHVAGRDVVGDGVAGDVVERVGGTARSRSSRPITTASSTSQSTR